MSLIPGMERSSANYLKELEDRFVALQDEKDKLELNSNNILNSKDSSLEGATAPDSNLSSQLNSLIPLMTDLCIQLKRSNDNNVQPVSPPAVPVVSHSTAAPNGPLGPQPTVASPAQSAGSSTSCAQASGPPGQLGQMGPSRIDPGRLLRPEYFVFAKKNASFIQDIDVKANERKNLEIFEFIFGCVQVLKHLHLNQDSRVASYIAHLEHIFTMLMTKNYSVKSGIDYNCQIVDEVLLNLRNDFSVDSVLSQQNFLPCHNDFNFSSRRGRGRGGSRGFNRGPPRGSQEDQGFPTQRDSVPPEICYFFNYSECRGNCGKLHICKKCRGKHSGKGCYGPTESK